MDQPGEHIWARRLLKARNVIGTGEDGQSEWAKRPRTCASGMAVGPCFWDAAVNAGYRICSFTLYAVPGQAVRLP